MEAFSNLDETIQEEIKALMEKHKEDMDEVREKMKNTDLTDDEKEDLKEELKSINEAFIEDLKELV
jgi:ribosome recycling factor